MKTGLLLLGQVFAGHSFAQLAIGLIVILAVIAIVYIAARAFGLPIPQWLIQICVVLIVAFLCIAAIRLLLSM